MLTRAGLFLIVAATRAEASYAYGSALPVGVSIAPDGSYTISVGGAAYFQSGPTYFRADGAVYSTADASLHLTSPPSAPVPGSDALGAFSRVTMQWEGGGTSFTTGVRVYDDSVGAAVFEASWPAGANGTSAPGGSADLVTNGWPAIALNSSDMDHAAVGWGGRFLESSHAFAWANAANGIPSAGQHGGPVVVFDANFTAAVAVSSLNRHTVSVSALDYDKKSGSSFLSYGVIGSVTSIPPGFSVETIVAATAGGPTAGAVRWGGLARAAGNTSAPRPYDFTLDYLGYATDNGAYYYYNTEKGSDGKPLTYEQTLLDVLADAKIRGIPYRYLQLDSWWYPQGKGGGVTDWNATAKTFPDGLVAFHEKVGMPFYAHNRMWSSENVYASQNGGDYQFIVEPSNDLAIPVEARFWNDLLANASQWGMIVYEQDWMFTEAEGLNATRESATLTDVWLSQMADAALAANATVQYCMSLGRFVLSAVNLPAVTQFRAGDDYGPGQTAKCGFPYCVYYIGTTSLLGWAIGVAPSKDNFWTTRDQPGNPFHNATEPYNSMEAAIAALSTAPVQLGDGVGFTNVTLALATCTASTGRLLQPSRPATAIDACFAGDVWGASAGPVAARSHNLPVQSTHTLVSGRTWAHILTIGLNGSTSVRPADLPFDVVPFAGDAGALVYAGWSETRGVSFDVIGAFDAMHALNLVDAPDPHDWSLHHVAPIFSSGWALLGEAAKLVPVSVWRVQEVDADATSTRVNVRGDANETLTFSFAKPNGAGSWAVVTQTCSISAAGAATIVMGTDGQGSCE